MTNTVMPVPLRRSFVGRGKSHAWMTVFNRRRVLPVVGSLTLLPLSLVVFLLAAVFVRGVRWTRIPVTVEGYVGQGFFTDRAILVDTIDTSIGYFYLVGKYDRRPKAGEPLPPHCIERTISCYQKNPFRLEGFRTKTYRTIVPIIAWTLDGTQRGSPRRAEELEVLNFEVLGQDWQ